MGEKEFEIENKYNEKETMRLQAEELEIDIIFLEGELSALTKRKEKLPIEMAVHIFWVITFTLVLAALLMVDAGIFTLFKIGLIIVIPLYIKCIIDAVKKVHEWAVNLDRKSNFKGSFQNKTISFRINELINEVSLKKAKLSNLKEKMSLLQKEINQLKGNQNYWR